MAYAIVRFPQDFHEHDTFEHKPGGEATLITYSVTSQTLTVTDPGTAQRIADTVALLTEIGMSSKEIKEIIISVMDLHGK